MISSVSSPMLTKVFWVILLAPCCIKKLNASESRWENIALNKPCNMSSNYNTVNTCNASINNNTDTTFQWVSPGNCIHTAYSDPYPHWTVDLGQFYNISQITIFARDDNGERRRMTAVSVSVDQQPVYMFPNTASSIQARTTICPSSISQTQSTGCSVTSAMMPATSRTVTLARHDKPNDDSDAIVLNVCEVQVWVCLDGYYGVDCSNTCGVGCQEPCNKVNGTCTCIPGWKSPLCEVCNEGRYDPDCSNSCGAGCAGGSQCDNVTGNCSCKHDGWISPLCQVCSEGKYGSDCSNSCGAGCDGGTPCNNVNGNCSCKHDGWKLPLCQVCSEGRYDPDCSNSCGAGCAGGSQCNNVTGNCSCNHDGWKSPLCQECREGLYGKNCSDTCGSCQQNATCAPDTGHCPGGCDQGFTGNWCKDCEIGLWASNCSLPCGQCGGNKSCDKNTGHCLSSSCQFGWTGTLCLQQLTKCREGLYGQNCSDTCGSCQQNATCAPDTGYCPGGCDQGFTGNWCKDCEISLWASNCSLLCGQCGGNKSCDKNTGHCLSSSCQPGWTGTLCLQQLTKCREGLYGQNCSDTCGSCQQNATCAPDTGHCPGGCDQSFTGNWCKDCEIGLWASNCSLPCGQCGGNKSCDKNTGHCLSSSCQPGWTGTLCLQQLTMTQPNDPDYTVAIGAGIGGAVLVILVIVIVAVVFIKRRRLGRPQNSRMENAESSREPQSFISQSGGKTSTNSTLIAVVKPKVKHSSSSDQAVTSDHSANAHIYGNITSSGNESVTTPESSDSVYYNIQSSGNDVKPSPPPLAAKPKGSGLTTMEMKSKERSGDKAADGMTLTTPQAQKQPTSDRWEDEVPDEDYVYNHEDLYACYSSVSSTRSLMDNFQKYLLDCLASSDKLQEEFKQFPKGMAHSHAVGSHPDNEPKNRFKQLCAYDKTRVILKRPKDDSGTDYINASYIKGYHNDKAYIATQGPRANTVPDLWLMTWQENVRQIIMLTNLKEDGKVKCDQYWPAEGKTMVYGHVMVTTRSEEERADFIIRTFTLKLKGGGSKPREVQQYHYTAWPDHGVPAAGSLVNYWRYVTARAATAAPPLVHCSAGVGRSGTYIALDIAMDRKSRGLDVSVSSVVSELREQRSIMVQTEVQYKFLHEVILEAYSSRDTRMTINQFNSRFPGDIDVKKPSETVDKEFKLLIEMKRWAKPHHHTAELEENRHKSRDQNVLPEDDHLAYLNVHVRGRNQYINAVYLSSFKVKNGLLLTQLPLPHTRVDFWRLVEGCGVRTILSLGGKDDANTIKDYCQYWPQQVNEELQTGPYTVTALNAIALSKHLISYQMDLQSKGSKLPIKLLHYTDWSGDLPGNTLDLVQLLDKMKAITDDDWSKVIVQCLDGATRSGLFCVLYDVMCRVIDDKEVDIFSAVRYLHNVSPQAVTSEIQYRYCYLVAQYIKQNIGVYANA